MNKTPEVPRVAILAYLVLMAIVLTGNRCSGTFDSAPATATKQNE